MIATWLWHGEGVWHWLANTGLGSVVGFVLATALLTPAVKWIKDQLDPHTPGGLGDLLDENGVPTHIRLAQEEKNAPDV